MDSHVIDPKVIDKINEVKDKIISQRFPSYHQEGGEYEFEEAPLPVNSTPENPPSWKKALNILLHLLPPEKGLRVKKLVEERGHMSDLYLEGLINGLSLGYNLGVETELQDLKKAHQDGVNSMERLVQNCQYDSQTASEANTALREASTHAQQILLNTVARFEMCIETIMKKAASAPPPKIERKEVSFSYMGYNFLLTPGAVIGVKFLGNTEEADINFLKKIATAIRLYNWDEISKLHLMNVTTSLHDECDGDISLAIGKMIGKVLPS